MIIVKNQREIIPNLNSKVAEVKEEDEHDKDDMRKMRKKLEINWQDYEKE